jgi:regulator of replication initiation timing
MSDQADVAILTYELMKRMNANIQNLTLEVGDLKMRMASVEDHLSGLTVSMTHVTSRLDRLDERVARIERRLDLRDESES